MYRRVLPLLLTAVLLLSGCTAGQKNIPQKTDEKERTGQPSDMSGEGSMYTVSYTHLDVYKRQPVYQGHEPHGS